jgi:hypothetical protein
MTLERLVELRALVARCVYAPLLVENDDLFREAGIRGLSEALNDIDLLRGIIIRSVAADETLRGDEAPPPGCTTCGKSTPWDEVPCECTPDKPLAGSVEREIYRQWRAEH